MPLDLAGRYLLGPVAGDLVARADLAERRHLVAAARRLYVGAACVETARGRWIRRARDVSREQDRLALLLDHRVRNRHGREQGDGVGMERVVVELFGG